MLGSGSAGFTLIEMLAVLVVLSLAVAVAGFAIRSRTGRLDLTSAAAKIASLGRQARNQAIRSGGSASLIVDLSARTVAAATAAPLALPSDVDIEVVSARGESPSDGVAAITFFPNGSATGGTIRLQSLGAAREIRVNWFTGRVIVHDTR